MDIKLKSNKRKVFTAAAVIIILAIVSTCILPTIGYTTSQKMGSSVYNNETIDEDEMQALYRGCYVLYLEHMQNQQYGSGLEASDLYLNLENEDLANITEEQSEEIDYYARDVNDTMEIYDSEYELYRTRIDYYTTDGTYQETNTDYELGLVLSEDASPEKLDSLHAYYQDIIVLEFNENGAYDVNVYWCEEGASDAIKKGFLQVHRNNNYFGQLAQNTSDFSVKPITNFKVVYGISYTAAENGMRLFYTSQMYQNNYEIESLVTLLYAGAIFILLLLAIILPFIKETDMKKQQQEETESAAVQPDKNTHKWHLLELVCIGCILVMTSFQVICSYVLSLQIEKIYNIWNVLSGGASYDQIFLILMIFLWFVAIYTIVLVAMLVIKPVFTVGLRTYVKNNSFIYQIFPWLTEKWNQFVSEVEHIDFTQKSTKTILKIVIINFIILAILMCMWMFGIFALLIYSLVIFYLLKKYYDKIARDYRALMNATSRIADGDLNTAITEDIGIFEPFKNELSKIRHGFKKAVDDEVKSQKMKTELITNVSHDLKTPLTAITTYIQLLKKEDITEEERRSYIDTLDKKSMRLKVLIEDLFEVSKANSQNVTLKLMSVDVVNLMKQVSIEHADKYQQMGIELRWNIPEEKVVLQLDNQKAYRIFENLFVNIQKYGMPNSRVYIDILHSGEDVTIVMKNMSAYELNVRPEELTERFVRGDSARNTEGSGLGLAIAKSFTELQKGKFQVDVDGDLFKVVIQWKCDKIEK